MTLDPLTHCLLCHLGSVIIISKDGDINGEVNMWLAKAATMIFRRLDNVWKPGSLKLRKLQLYSSVVAATAI